MQRLWTRKCFSMYKSVCMDELMSSFTSLCFECFCHLVQWLSVTGETEQICFYWLLMQQHQHKEPSMHFFQLANLFSRLFRRVASTPFAFLFFSPFPFLSFPFFPFFFSFMFFSSVLLSSFSFAFSFSQIFFFSFSFVSFPFTCLYFFFSFIFFTFLYFSFFSFLSLLLSFPFLSFLSFLFFILFSHLCTTYGLIKSSYTTISQ